MPVNSSGTREGLAIAAGVLVLTAFFAWRHWHERRSRDDEGLSTDDARYFRRKDIRRTIGTTVLGLIGVGMIVGSILNPRVQKMPFLYVWLGVLGLVMIMIGLALADWFANFGYAKRHRYLLIEERLKLIEDAYKTHNDANNGHGLQH